MITPSPPTARQPRVPSVAVTVDGRIAEDKLCIDCGYNLRGLKPEGRCPECGGAVRVSLRGHELQAASLPWLRSIRRGFGLLKQSVLLAFLAVVAGILVGFALSSLIPDARLLNRVTDLAISVFLLIVLLAAVYGFVCATRVEPRVLLRGEDWTARRLTRILTALTLALWAVFWLLRELMPKSVWMDQVVVYTPLLLTVLGALAIAALVQYVIALLERTAEEKTLKEAKRTRSYVLLAVVLAAVVLLIDASAPLLRPGSEIADRVQMWARPIRGIRSCVNIIFVLAALQLVWRVAKILDRILVIAEANQLPPSTPIATQLS